MPLQDLTPQLRTRLSRMERAVGWFVLLATALLVSGFGYYVYHTAERRGWFVTKARYFTLIDRATGLKVGDPVKLMGFDVGQITRIEAQPPNDFYYNVYVEFEIKAPYYGYLWTEGSRAKVSAADFLGKRELEVTKGSGGTATYVFNPLKDLSLDQLRQLPSPEKWLLAEDVYDGQEPRILLHALTPLTPETVKQLAALGRRQARVLDTREDRKSMTGVWTDRAGRFEPFARTNLYWLRPDEVPAVTERLQKLVTQVEQALPGFFALTNQIAQALDNTADLTSNLNTVAIGARPAVSNLTALSAQLRGQGALGGWLLSADGQRQFEQSLTHANQALTNADATLTALSENLARSLDNLAGITSNLHAQVQANTNIVSAISDAVVHTDELVQGLKRHWLLRSVFKVKATNAPPRAPLLPPKRW